MSRKAIIILHTIYWVYASFISTAANQFIYEGKISADEVFLHPLMYTMLLVSMSTFYMNYFVFIPRFLKRNQFLSVVISSVALFLFFIGFRYLMEEIVYRYFSGHGNYKDGISLIYYVFDNLYYASSPIFMSFVLWLLANYVDSQQEKKQLLREKQAAEISFLKTQINPHFVFNSLNNIYSLVYQKSDKALFALEKFSALHRYILKESENEKTLLVTEMNYIESLIELESLRTGKETNIVVEQTITNQGTLIPSLLLIPMVENGFKHGDVCDPEVPFTIKLISTEDRLIFETQNKMTTKQKDSTPGIGLKNVKRRLELLYPRKHALHIHEENALFTVTLTIHHD